MQDAWRCAAGPGAPAFLRHDVRPTWTHRQTDRQTDKQTDRQTDLAHCTHARTHTFLYACARARLRHQRLLTERFRFHSPECRRARISRWCCSYGANVNTEFSRDAFICYLVSLWAFAVAFNEFIETPVSPFIFCHNPQRAGAHRLSPHSHLLQDWTRPSIDRCSTRSSA
jgi:hypothetical protein